jgi:hypothetical protein
MGALEVCAFWARNQLVAHNRDAPQLGHGRAGASRDQAADDDVLLEALAA